MNKTIEETVTKILSAGEIIRVKKNSYSQPILLSNSEYNLGEYLKAATPEPSRFGSRYVFVK